MGHGERGQFRLKYATNFKPLAPLCGQAHTHTHTHTHTPRGSPSFYTKRKAIKNRFTFMVNDAYGHSGPGLLEIPMGNPPNKQNDSYH